MEILRAEHLIKIYKSGSVPIKALDDVSFSVESGEFIAVVGASGSGKSTLLHVLGSVERPDSGKVYLNGEDVFAQKTDTLARFRRRRVGIIYQFFNLMQMLTVKENIELPALLDDRVIDEEDVRELIRFLGLEGREDAFPHQLSGGQMQRVSIGRTLINHPSVILADEPTGNLDSYNTQQILDLLKRINKQDGQTVILITHDENVALQADRIITLEDGRIVHDDRN